MFKISNVSNVLAFDFHDYNFIWKGWKSQKRPMQTKTNVYLLTQKYN